MTGRRFTAWLVLGIVLGLPGAVLIVGYAERLFEHQPPTTPAIPPCTLKPGEVAHITAWVEGNQVVARCEIYRGKT